MDYSLSQRFWYAFKPVLLLKKYIKENLIGSLSCLLLLPTILVKANMPPREQSRSQEGSCWKLTLFPASYFSSPTVCGPVRGRATSVWASMARGGPGNLHPKMGQKQGRRSGGEGTVVNVTCVSANLLPKPLPGLFGWMLLLEFHQKGRGAVSNIRVKWVYVVDPPNSEISSTSKNQTKHNWKNQQTFSMWFSLSFELNSKPVSSYSTRMVYPLNNPSFPTPVCGFCLVFPFSLKGLCIC